MAKLTIRGEEISQELKEQILISLSMRIAFIETGDPVLRANDAIRMGKSDTIRQLGYDQRKLIIELEDLWNKLLS